MTQDVPKLKPTVYIEAVPELVAARRRGASDGTAVTREPLLPRLRLRDIFGSLACHSER
ncbi:MAG TPA: hypothetical protein VFU41_05520 [Gemmatimonadales bacterium]|nr:hypothetical protein [Gemmatimonadales bacterium]